MSDRETVLVPTVDRSELHYHRERFAGIPKCGPIGANYERRPRETAAEFAEPCGSCFRDELRADGGEEVLGWTRGRYPHVSGQRVLHTERDCQHLQQASQVREVTDDAEADDLDTCQRCAGQLPANEPDFGYQAALKEAGEDLVTDGGRPRQRRVDQVVAAVLEDGPRPSDHLRDQLRADGGEELPDRDQTECERRARQAAHTLIAWSDRAGIDPEIVFDDVRDGIPSGREPAHYCEICSTGFDSIVRLIDHDCDDQDAPLVTDGGHSKREADFSEAGQSIFNWEPVAAAQFEGSHECQYECENTADWAVEWKTSGYTGGRVSLICQPCSRTNRVYADENNLNKHRLSQDALDVLPEEVAQSVDTDSDQEASR